MPEFDEPAITINGVPLTVAQSMTVRVALQNFAMELNENGLGSDKMGKSISRGYLNQIGAINQIIGP